VACAASTHPTALAGSALAGVVVVVVIGPRNIKIAAAIASQQNVLRTVRSTAAVVAVVIIGRVIQQRR
jgi:hypothetical protein